jgi:hypothetical protein
VRLCFSKRKWPRAPTVFVALPVIQFYGGCPHTELYPIPLPHPGTTAALHSSFSLFLLFAFRFLTATNQPSVATLVLCYLVGASSAHKPSNSIAGRPNLLILSYWSDTTSFGSPSKLWSQRKKLWVKSSFGSRKLVGSSSGGWLSVFVETKI